jgi:deoxyinosine 3'endonuclease (endonuclease V)
VTLGEKHSWSVSPRQAAEIQQQLTARVIRQRSGSPIHLVAGADCAKRRLCGSFIELEAERGSCSTLTDRGEIVGTVLRTRSGVKPVFVSIGHRIDPPTAEWIILSCTLCYRLPQPLRLAHRAAVKALKQEMRDPG